MERAKSLISAIVLVHNEEKNIKKCIESLLWCSEVIVIDDNSTDKTTTIAKKLGAKLCRRTLANDFASQRNYGLSKAKSEWILFIDADEIVTKELRNEILEKIKSTQANGFCLKRDDYFLGNKLIFGETADGKFLRLARKNSGKWVRAVHETWNIKGEIETLENHLIHHAHDNLSEFIEDLNYYSTLHAKELKKENKKAALWKIIAYPAGKFIVNYFFKLGFLDGVHGFLLAVLMSFHSFLSQTKIWLD